MNPNDEALVAKLRLCVETRTLSEFRQATARLDRKEIYEIIDLLDPPEVDPEEHMFRDAKGAKIAIDDRIMIVVETSPGNGYGTGGIVVGLGNKRGDDIVVCRMGDERFVRKIHPAKVTLR